MDFKITKYSFFFITVVLVFVTGFRSYSQPTKLEDKFIAAAATGDFEKVQNYLKKGVDVNAKNKARWTALGYACKYGHMETVVILLDNNADINLAVNVGTTPLQIALNSSKYDIAEYLISRNAEINIKDITGMTALAWAAKNGDLKTIDFLLNNGADINSVNVNGRSVLDNAGTEEAKELLKQKGAKTSKELMH